MNELTQKAKVNIEQAKGRLLRSFQHVPDDKLNWSPSATARTPLQIVAHCGFSSVFLGKWIAGELQLPSSPEELKAVREEANAREKSVKSREAAIQLVEENTAQLISLLEAIPAAELEMTREHRFFGTVKVADLLYIPALHLQSHAAQLDYIQTIWGDMEWHF